MFFVCVTHVPDTVQFKQRGEAKQLSFKEKALTKADRRLFISQNWSRKVVSVQSFSCWTFSSGMFSRCSFDKPYIMFSIKVLKPIQKLQ